MTNKTNDKEKNEKIITPDDKNTTQSGGFKYKSDKQGSELADNVSKAVQGDTKAAKEVYNQAKESVSSFEFNSCCSVKVSFNLKASVANCFNSP